MLELSFPYSSNQTPREVSAFPACFSSFTICEGVEFFPLLSEEVFNTCTIMSGLTISLYGSVHSGMAIFFSLSFFCGGFFMDIDVQEFGQLNAFCCL